MAEKLPSAERASRSRIRPVVIRVSGELPKRSDQAYGLWSVATSALVHVVALGLTAMIYFSRPSAVFVSDMDSGWIEPAPAKFDVEMPSSADRGAGDIRSNVIIRHATPANLMELSTVDSSDDVLALNEPAATSIVIPKGGTTERRGRRTTAGKAHDVQTGAGPSGGKGDRGGSRAGFFGRRATGNRIVFVVDNSGSMKRPDSSQLESRYSRVKSELVKSILEMTPSDEFYVVFFCETAFPMPSRIMQPATDEKKAIYLEWIAEVETGGGPTNPCGAMKIALRLKPDVIYFLTDGEFDKGVNTNLLDIHSDSIIHTFAFGEQLGEDILKEVAANNNGEYKFVP